MKYPFLRTVSLELSRLIINLTAQVKTPFYVSTAFYHLTADLDNLSDNIMPL